VALTSTLNCFSHVAILGAMLEVQPNVCRAARALLGWDQDRLADEAHVGLTTLRNFENGKSAPRPAILAAVRGALERGGVVLIEEEGGGGVKLRVGG